MPETYACQIPGLAVVMSILGLGGGAFIASRIDDRNTRRIEAAERGRDRE